MNETHQRQTGRNGKRVCGIRVVHKPCAGSAGSRFSISLPHARQKEKKDNLRILHALTNSSGISDLKRLLGIDTSGKKIGVSRIYNWILWLEEVFLAYEREMLRRWRKRVENSNSSIQHRLSHDDIVLSVNWEAATTRATTALNCSVTADVDSGYVYRIDVDFDPTVEPMKEFRKSYLDENGMPDRIGWTPTCSEGKPIPKFAWQRPTGRFHEQNFFAACENELKAFLRKSERNRTKDDPSLHDDRKRVESDTELVRFIGTEWFGFDVDNVNSGGSFGGMTTRDIYTKAAHFVLLKDMRPPGKIILTTEQEGTLPPLLPHIFRDEIKQNRFTWLAMTFDKAATKPQILGKVNAYRKAWQKFHDDGLYDGVFELNTPKKDVTKSFIMKHMQTALRAGGRSARPIQTSNYERRNFPDFWVHSPTQASGEIDKKVGFPIADVWLRHRLKELRYDVDVQSLDDEIKEEIADLIYNATLQPASTFMNSVRERLGATARAGAGGARKAGSYIQGALFDPGILIALLNIFRVYYNFFELRPYATIDSEIDDAGSIKVGRRSIKYPGTDELILLPKQRRRRSIKKTPAMRHGIDRAKRNDDGTYTPPNLSRVLYRPWLYAGTAVGKRLDR